MADNAQQSVGAYDPVRVRREELIRPDDRRRDFTTREAQRRLQQKERPHWALIAYGVFLAAVLIIFSVAYTTYAFSKYRGEILPGVHVDRVSLSGLTQTGAVRLLKNQDVAIYNHPVRLVYGSLPPWTPPAAAIGYHPDEVGTVAAAMQVGRQESFFEQLLDRLPIHPDHAVPLRYVMGDKAHPPDSELRGFILQRIASDPRVNHQPVNANLKIDQNTGQVLLLPSHPGNVLDVQATIATVHAALGSLVTQTKAIAVHYTPPSITTAYARRFRTRVERFLAHPPILAVGQRVIVASRKDFAPAFSFRYKFGKGTADIVMVVNSDAVSAYVASLAKTVDQAAQNPRLDYQGGQVRVLSPRRDGRTLDQADAVHKLLTVIRGLQPHARLHLKVTVTKPPLDRADPASLGINTTLGYGRTTFQGAPATRVAAITQIANTLDKDLIQPNQDISFNTLVASTWSSNVYTEAERDVSGKIVPGRGGAMQQVATTFLRALYAAGFQLEERHAHAHRFSWYEPPVGLDAVVDPAKNFDLRFRNSTRRYVFIKTRVEPVRQELYVYVYGPNLGWKVSVDPLGKITKKYLPGPEIVRQDPSLAPGDIHPIAFAHDGADTVIERTIVYAHGKVKVDRLTTHYDPWRSILLEGTFPNPSPTAKAKSNPTTTPGAGATPTPTFSH